MGVFRGRSPEICLAVCSYFGWVGGFEAGEVLDCVETFGGCKSMFSLFSLGLF